MKKLIARLTRATMTMAAISTALMAAPATAAYPDRPIRMIVPAATGGAADTLARMVAKRLSEKYGQPVVVENKPGAAAIIGMGDIAKAQPDGYTVGMTFSGAMSINPSLYQSLSYSPLKDFEPIAMVAVSPLVIAASPKLGVKSLEEMLAMARKNPGKLTFASTGAGSTQHLSMELFKSVFKVDMLHIPYKGSAAGVIDVQSGLVSTMSDNAITLLPFIQSGQLVPLAVQTATRIPALPNVPTVAELGHPGYLAESPRVSRRLFG